MRRATTKRDDNSFKSDGKVDVKVNTFNIQKISFELKCKNESQKNLVNLINKNDISICAGPAGTGKTFVACAQALKLLKKDDKFLNEISMLEKLLPKLLEDDEIKAIINNIKEDK